MEKMEKTEKETKMKENLNLDFEIQKKLESKVKSNIIDRLISIYLMNKKIENDGVQTLAPILYGDTGVGKTSIVNEFINKISEIKNKKFKMVKILLQTMLPEETIGIPKVIETENGFQTVWTLPEWFDENDDLIIFFDELDKAHPETISSILTLLASREIRGKNISKDSFIILGCQPMDTTIEGNASLEALVARMNFIPVNVTESISYLNSKYGIDLSSKDINNSKTVVPPYDALKNNEITYPTLGYLSPRQTEYLINLINNSFVEKENEDIVNEIIKSEEFKNYSSKDLQKIKVLSMKHIIRLRYNTDGFCHPSIYTNIFNAIIKNKNSSRESDFSKISNYIVKEFNEIFKDGCLTFEANKKFSKNIDIFKNNSLKREEFYKFLDETMSMDTLKNTLPFLPLNSKDVNGLKLHYEILKYLILKNNSKFIEQTLKEYFEKLSSSVDSNNQLQYFGDDNDTSPEVHKNIFRSFVFELQIGTILKIKDRDKAMELMKQYYEKVQNIKLTDDEVLQKIELLKDLYALKFISSI